MAGSGPQQQAVETQARALGVLTACDFPGVYSAPEDKGAFMQSLDVFVLPTLAEGTPNSIIEAMAHGLPVIASAVGGIPDLITPETGLLVPPGEPAALAHAMMQLASDPDLRARMGRAARVRYEQLFSPQVVLPALVDAYRRIATSKNDNHAQPPTPRLTRRRVAAAELDLTTTQTLRGKRIIFVLGSLEVGGAERQALMLAGYLSEQAGAQVEVWGFNRTGPARAMCEQYGLAWRVVPYRLVGGSITSLPGLARLARLLRRARPDILLPYTLLPNVVCGLIWPLTGARVCVWNQRDEGIARLNARLERWAVARVPQFIANSRQGARFLVDKLRVDEAKVAVVHNGVDSFAPQMERAAWRRQLQLDEGCFVACMVANLHQHKDHKTLLRAWGKVVPALAAAGRSAVLLLAGRCDDAYESLRALALELMLNESVRFLDHVTDLPGLLGAVDLSVFSSRSEGCPNGVLESMAAGLAVAGTDIAGIREAVGPVGWPFLTPPGDADALAASILKLAHDPVLCAQVGAENQTRISTEYDANRMCRETVSLLVNFFPEAAHTDEAEPLRLNQPT